MDFSLPISSWLPPDLQPDPSSDLLDFVVGLLPLPTVDQ
jgi:hypothetical protein